MRNKFNYGIQNKTFDGEQTLEKLYQYLRYEKRFSAVNLDTTMKEARSLLHIYRIDRFDVETARRIEEDMIGRGLAPKTIINRLTDYELMAAANGVDLKVKKPKRIRTKKEYLTIAECRALMDAADNVRDKAIISLILHTGVRVSSLTLAKLDDLNIRDRTMVIRQATKNYQEYRVVLSRACIADLEGWLTVRPSGAAKELFLNVYGNKLHARSITRIVKQTAARAGIEKRVFAHMLRTTCATTLLRSGICLTSVSLQLGHTNLQSTMVYLVGREDDLRKDIDDKFVY